MAEKLLRREAMDWETADRIDRRERGRPKMKEAAARHCREVEKGETRDEGGWRQAL